MPPRSSVPKTAKNAPVTGQFPAHEQPLKLTGTPARSSLRRKMTFAFAGVTVLTIVISGCTAFTIARSVLSSRVLDQVGVMATVREDYLEKALQSEREQTSAAALRPELHEAIAPETASALVTSLFAHLRGQNVYTLGVTLYTPRGGVIASTGDRSEALPDTIAGSVLIPFIDRKEGWIASDVYVPLTSADGTLTGYLAARYDVFPILAAIFSPASLGRDAEITLSTEQDGDIYILQHSRTDPLRSYRLGSADETHLYGTPLVRAAEGEEGVGRMQDDRGRDVFAAYRYLPSMGWGMSVDVPAESALYGISILAISLAVIGALLLLLACMLAYIFSRHITGPLTHLSQKMRQLKPGQWDFRRTVTSGDEVEVLDAAFAELTGRLHGIYDTLEDTIAERTAELRKESALDRAILETIEYGVVAVDPEGIITDVNPAALQLLGWEEKDVIGKQSTLILQYAQRRKTLPNNEHPVTTTLRGNQSFRSRASNHPSLLRKNQTLLPVTFLVTPLLQGKKLLGAIAVFQDMTEERQIDYLKSEFISLASHQLRTPLSSIRWYVELMAGEEKSAMTADQKSYFKEIDKAAKRMASLLEALLHVAKLEGGGVVAELHEEDLRAVAEQIADEWSPSMKEKGVSFTVILPPPGTIVRTDPVLLQVVVQNFLNNSMKYTPKGKEITLSIRREGAKFILSVRDTGVGIPTAEQRRVFEKFFRAHNVRQMDTDGTGLGLYMSKAIAEKLGGAIFFESQEGRGSTFTLVLPGRKGA